MNDKTIWIFDHYSVFLTGCGSQEPQSQTTQTQIKEIDIRDISGTWRGEWESDSVLEIKFSPSDTGNRKEFKGSMSNIGCLVFSQKTFDILIDTDFIGGTINGNKINFESMVGQTWTPPGANLSETIDGIVKIEGELDDFKIRGNLYS